MKTLKVCILPFLILSLFCCSSSYKILKSDQETGFRLANYPTYGFYEIEVKGDTSSKTFEKNIELIKQEIAANLKERGLNEAQDPELKINIALSVKEEIQTRQTNFQTDGYPRYMGQRRYSWKSEEVPVGRYKEGVMLIDFVDTANNKMVWKGGAKGILPEKDQKLSQKLTEVLDGIFSKIP